jgi:dienelactone hydrolase
MNPLKIGIVLIFVTCFALSHGAPAETVQFHSAAVPATPLQTRLARERGTVAHAKPGDLISAELYHPAGDGPFPALIALHGCAGRPEPASEQAMAARFTEHGYLVLAVDSFGPRGISEQCNGVTAAADRMSDAYGALDWLASQTFAIPTRIALLGFSQGADIGLSIASSGDSAQSPGAATFAVAILYYPYCRPGGAVVKMPTLVLVGERDDWASAKECRAMMALRSGAGAAERLIVYPGAQHGFNFIGLRDHPRTLYGYHLAYDEAADHAASQAAIAFLAEWMVR